MEPQIIPKAPKWHLLNGFEATPDNGFLYVSTFSIVYISGTKRRTDKPRVKIFHVKNFIKGIACDPDWSDSRYFAAFTHQNTILIFDTEGTVPILGHKGHLDGGGGSEDKVRPNSSMSAIEENQQGVLCFTTNKRVYSIHNEVFVNYCVRSNTWIVEKVNFRLNKNHPTIMKASPYDPNIVALGTRAGLIMIGDLKKKLLLYTLRGHDQEITSLDWMQVRTPKQKEKSNFIQKEPKNLKPLHDDTTELFDIYSYDDLENEFGVETDSQDAVNMTLEGSYSSKDVITENENFNFVEACQTLKEEMLAKPEYGGDESINRPTADEIKDTYNLDCDRSNRTIDDSNRSVSSREDISSEEMGEFKPEPEAISDENAKDFIMVNTFERQVDDENTTVYVVSGARENVIWFWDADNGTAVDKIIMNTTRHVNNFKPVIIVSWLNETTLISTNPNGEICEWKLNFMNCGKIKVKITDKVFVENSVYAMSTNKISSDSQICPLLWSLTYTRNGYCTSLNDNENIFVFGTTGIPINYITECPMDMNKIAIACCDRRICVINVSNLKPNSIPIISLVNKIRSKVLSLAWHPTREHILAYSTSEGQVGIYDTTKSTNVPIRIKAFTGLAVYTLSWGEISSDNNKKSVYALFASDKVGKFVYIPETGDRKHQPIPIKDFTKVSEVSCFNNLMAVGTISGRLIILNLKNNFEVVYSEENLTRKYISCLSWNPINKNLLAISSDDGTITIMDNTKPLEKRKLVGHVLGVASIKWSNNSLNKLVSASFDLTVRVWDINSLSAISISIFRDSMFTAIFSPLDDNFIICAGNRDPLTIYDTRTTTYSLSDVRERKIRNKADGADIAMKWATEFETVNPNKRKEQRQNLKLDELSTKLETITVDDETTVSKLEVSAVASQVVNATLCYLTNVELNRDALKSIQYLLDEKSELGDGDHGKFVYHQKLFASRHEINELLQNELKNLKSSMSNTIGNILLPQIMGELKSEILDKIEKKQLTEHHVAVSPHISHEFWRVTCKAYGYQCIEKGHVLNAIQYLLATHEINDAIESLCKVNYYREAWIIAKLHKESDDPSLAHILDKWTNHLTYCGNFVGLALLHICNQNYKSALESLYKIKNQTEDINNVMEILKMKL